MSLDREFKKKAGQGRWVGPFLPLEPTYQRAKGKESENTGICLKQPLGVRTPVRRHDCRRKEKNRLGGPRFSLKYGVRKPKKKKEGWDAGERGGWAGCDYTVEREREREG